MFLAAVHLQREQLVFDIMTAEQSEGNNVGQGITVWRTEHPRTHSEHIAVRVPLSYGRRLSALELVPRKG